MPGRRGGGGVGATDTRERLDTFDVLRGDEIAAVMPALLNIGVTPKSHGDVYRLLAPARERFLRLSDEDRLAFRDALTMFVRIYSFPSQAVTVAARSWNVITSTAVRCSATCAM